MRWNLEEKSLKQMSYIYVTLSEKTVLTCGRWRLVTRIALCWGNPHYPGVLKEGIPSVCAWSSGGYFRSHMVSVWGTNQLLGHLHCSLEIVLQVVFCPMRGFSTGGQNICTSLQGMTSDVCLPKGAKGFSCSSHLFEMRRSLLIASDLRLWQQDFMGQTRWALAAKANMQPSVLQFIRLPSWELMEVVR